MSCHSRRALAPSFASALTLTLMACLAVSCGNNSREASLAIVGATVIDATGVRAHQTVIANGDTIVSVADTTDQEPEATTVIDGTGLYLIPGLWDMHVHLTYDARFTESMPALFLAHGITSVRDTGGMVEELRPVVERWRMPTTRAPQVFWSGPLLDGEFVVYDGEARPQIGIQNATPEQARENVDALAQAGVDFIKIYEMVSPDVFHALVEAANEHQLPIASHVPLSMLARNAGPEVGSMEHLRNLELDCSADSESLLEARRRLLQEHTTSQGPGADLRATLHALQRVPAMDAFDQSRCSQTLAALGSTIQVPTLRLNTLGLHPPFAREDWPQASSLAPKDAQDEWRAVEQSWRQGTALRDPTFAQFSLHLTGLLHEAGVPIGAGTDTPIGISIPGYSLHTELERLFEAGLTPLEALTAATLRPAEFFGLEEEMGTIEAGRRADLLLLGQDPLESITNTRAIERVIAAGEPLVPADLLGDS